MRALKLLALTIYSGALCTNPRARSDARPSARVKGAYTKIGPFQTQKRLPPSEPLLSQPAVLFFLLQWLIQPTSHGVAQSNSKTGRNDTLTALSASQMHRDYLGLQLAALVLHTLLFSILVPPFQFVF